MIFPNEFILYVQIISIVIFILMMIGGYKDGFLLKLCDLLSSIIALICALVFSKEASQAIQIVSSDYFDFGVEELNNLLSAYANQFVMFFLIFIVVKLIFTLIRPFFKGINKIPLFGSLNQFLGIFAGGLHAYLILLLVTMLFSGPLYANGNEVLVKSKLIYIKDSAQSVMKYMGEQYEVIHELSEDPKYMDDEYANIRIWFDYYGIDPVLQEEMINVLRSE